MRHEVKIVGAELDEPRILAELRLLPGAPRQLFAPRVVQSVYFDTHGGDALQENLAGVSARRKLRFRWYGEEADTVRGQLEWKRRDNALGSKDVLALAADVKVTGERPRALVERLRELVPPLWQERLHARQPAQWIRYRRRYLTSADRRLRITVDTGLLAADQRALVVLSRRHTTPLPRVTVVEIKAAAEHGDEVERCVQRLDLPRSKCSKYVLACAPAEAPEVSRYW